MFLWIVLLVVAVVPPAFGRCSCLCVEGTPRTLCTEILEAQLNPTMCSSAAFDLCPTQNAEDVGDRATYVSPFAEGVNCREVRVWDPIDAGYVAVKVCDVISGDVR